MAEPKMHADEVNIDGALVRRLLVAQFPEWSALPIEPVYPRGTDNALYRLGDEMVARLPRIEGTVRTLQKEREWLPRLASSLPVAVPLPLADGLPGEDYPFPWSVYTWLHGEPAHAERIRDPDRFASDLAGFVGALQRIESSGAPQPGKHNFGRGAPLATRDDATCAAIDALRATIDADAFTGIWEEGLAASEWTGTPVWVHGDLDARNILVADGRLSAVIDFGALGIGDPAYDVMVVWKVLSADTRDVFRRALSVDDATWARSRGLAVSQAVIALAYYTLETNAVLVREAEHWLREVLAE